LVISNIDIDVDIIDDTFDVSIDIDINDTFVEKYRLRYRRYFVGLFSTLNRYFSTDMQNDAHNFLSFRAFIRIQRSVAILDERRITCNKI